jgi:hypothetical protein
MSAVARYHLHPDVGCDVDPQGGGGVLRLPGGQSVRWRAAGGALRLAETSVLPGIRNAAGATLAWRSRLLPGSRGKIGTELELSLVDRRAMHILFLTDNFPPETNAPASRTFEHARRWVAAGHRVTVVTGAPNFPSGKLHAGYRNALWGRETMDGIDVVRVCGPTSPPTRAS